VLARTALPDASPCNHGAGESTCFHGVGMSSLETPLAPTGAGSYWITTRSMLHVDPVLYKSLRPVTRTVST